MKLRNPMKRLQHTWLLLSLATLSSFGQAINTYTFTTGTGGSISTLSSPTTLIAAGVDDAATAVLSFPGGFSFVYGGTAFTQFSVSSNGALNFGAIACSNAYSNTLSSVGNSIKVTPFWDDIITTGLGVRYQLIGTAPYRSLVFIWDGIDYTTRAAVQFQLTLLETTNVITFDYGAGSGGTANIGICNSATEFLSVKTTNNSVSTSTANNSVAWPGSGRYYTFTPPLIAPAIASFTPSNGCANSTTVTISGTNLGGVTAVKFGGTNAQTFTIHSPTSISAVPATGTSGAITVVNAAGTATSASTFTVNALPTVGAAASPSAAVCGGSSVMLSGTGAASYTWSGGVTNGVLFVPTATTTYTVTGTSASGCSNTSTVTITYTSPPTVANAGADQNMCTGIATLAANSAVTGSGTWTKISGNGGSFSNPGSPVSTFTGLPGNAYTLRWTISNASCTSSDDVVITFLSNRGSVISNNGTNTIDISISPTGIVTNPGTGCQWYYNYGVAFDYAITVSGAGASTIPVNMQVSFGCTGGNGGTTSYSTISSTGSSSGSKTTGYDITVPAIAANNYGSNPDCSHATLSNLNCSNSATVTVWGGTGTGSFSQTLQVALSPTVSNAGPDQTVCGQLSTTLQANAPLSGTGTWSIISGTGGSLAASSNPASAFTGVAGSSYTLRWTIDNGSCASSTDEVVISFRANPTAANAGPDKIICGTTTNLEGNTAVSGTGSWSIISGSGAVISNVSSPTASFTGMPGNTYILRWAIANSSCTVSADTVSISLRQNPTQANAGTDQVVCGTTCNLQGNTPALGTGTWSIISGTGGVIAQSTSATSLFTGIAGQSYTLCWSIANPTCPASSDTVIINFMSAPSQANAGVDTEVCSLSTTLSANIPLIGTGTWSILSGNGGVIADSGNPVSLFSGLSGVTYVLRWSISNSPCLVSTDDVEIKLFTTPTANAGSDQSVCSNGQVALNGSIGGSANAATWSSSGDGSFNPDAHSLQATYMPGTSDKEGGMLELSLTTNSPSAGCAVASATMHVQVVPFTVLHAGSDNEVCGTDTLLLSGSLSGAVAPVIWSSGGDGIFSDPSSLQSKYLPGISDRLSGRVMLILSSVASSGVCAALSDTALFIVRTSVPSQPEPVTGAPVSICPPMNGIMLSVTEDPLASRYSWEVSPGSNAISFATPSITHEQTVNLATTTNSGYSIRVIAHNACGASDFRATYIRRATSVPVAVGGSQVACGGRVQTYLTGSITGATSYQWTAGNGILINGNTSPQSLADTVVQLTFPSTFSTGTVCVSSQVACFTSAVKCLTVSSASPALNSLSGNPVVCPGAVETYKVPSTPGAASYTWTLPANTTGNSLADSISIAVLTGYTSGSICVKANNICGLSTPFKCQQITTGVPAKPAAITGPPMGVCGQNITYAVPSNPSATHFSWTFPTGTTFNGATDGNSVNVTMPSTLGTGTISVVAVNNCGSSLARSITVKGLPAQPGVISSNPSAFCANTSGVTFTADSGSVMPGSALLWTYPSACSYISGQGTEAITLNWGSSNGTVSLKATNACGSATRTFPVTLVSLRTAGNTAHTGNENATDRTAGNMGRTEQTMNLQAYPDAEQKILTFTFYSEMNQRCKYSLMDAENREVRQGEVEARPGVNMEEIDMGSLPSNGVYRLIIRNGEQENHIDISLK